MAKQFDGQVLWRTMPDGTTYIATLRDGTLERYLVHEDGSTTLVDSSSGRFGRRWLYATLALGGILFVGGGLAADATDRPGLAVVVVAGWLLWAAAIIVGGRGADLAARAHRAYGGKDEWHFPTDLRGWEPRSSAQLAAIERIADEHAGVAYVRDVGARTVDVSAVGKGRVNRYWVDEAGNAEVAETSAVGAPYLIDRALKATALCLWFGLIVVAFAVQEHKGLLIAVVVAALTLVMLLGWRNDPEARLSRRLKSGVDHWIEIRTQEPDNDA